MIILAYLLFLVILFLTQQIDKRFLISGFAAIVISFFNYFLAIFLYRFSLKSNNNLFFKFNLGGLVIRILLMLILIFYCLNFLNIEVYAFIFQLIIFYFLLQIFEIKLFAEYKQR